MNKSKNWSRWQESPNQQKCVQDVSSHTASKCTPRWKSDEEFIEKRLLKDDERDYSGWVYYPVQIQVRPITWSRLVNSMCTGTYGEAVETVTANSYEHAKEIVIELYKKYCTFNQEYEISTKI